jgi:hypothetical protein
MIACRSGRRVERNSHISAIHYPAALLADVDRDLKPSRVLRGLES